MSGTAYLNTHGDARLVATSDCPNLLLKVTSMAPQNLPARLWRYQAERFPLGQHGLLIAAFASSGVSLAALLSGQITVPPLAAFGVAFGVLLSSFLLLRIADEFKDAAADAQYRPQRPVPRGLVSLRELAGVGGVMLGLQLLLVLAYDPSLLGLLGLLWGYLYLMQKEFYCAAWLHAHPLAYMLSHMLIMPLLDLFATACVWWPQQPPPGLAGFLALSFSNGLLIELGRKTWAPSQEQPGVESYSSAWGLRPALGIWLAALASAWALAFLTATLIDFTLPVLGGLSVLALFMGYTAQQLASLPTPAAARRLEQVSGLWVLASYLLLGPLPLVWQVS